MKNVTLGMVLIGNAVVLLFVADWTAALPEFVTVALVGLFLFVMPGLAWIPSTRAPLPSHGLTLLLVIALSVVIWSLTIIAHVLVGVTPNAASYALVTGAMMNLGFALNRRRYEACARAFFHPAMLAPYMVLAVGGYAFSFYGAAHIQPGADHDLEVAGAAPGLVQELKPYFSYNDPERTLYFAHPPLAPWITGLAAVLQNRLSDLDFYRISGKTAREALRSRPGETVTATYAYPPSEDRTVRMQLRNIDNTFFEARFMAAGGAPARLRLSDYAPTSVVTLFRSDTELVVRMDRKALTLFFFAQDSQDFYARNITLLVRSGFVVLNVLAAFILLEMACCAGLTPWRALVLALLYLSTPGIFVRAAMAGHVSVSELGTLALLLHLLALDSKRTLDWLHHPSALLPGAFAALADQKTIVVLLGYAVFVAISLAMDKAGRWRLRAAGFHAACNSGAIGWLAGNAAFMALGYVASWGDFVDHYLFAHGIDRLLGTSAYHPSLGTVLWNTTVEAPVLLLAVIPLAWLVWQRRWQDIGTHATGIVLCVLAVGTAIASAVDWKQSKHFMILVPVAVTLLAGVLPGLQRKHQKQIMFALALLSITYGLVLCFLLASKPSLYSPSPGFW